MDTLTIEVTGLAFVLSFIFALGGIGSAVALVPILNWMGYPLNEAKPTGLFVNTVSMVGASISNIRAKRLDFRLSMPIIIASIALAPIGAYASTVISQKVVLAVFVAFLLFSSAMMLFYKGGQQKDSFREDRPFWRMVGIGSVAGFISGLLGVGGGGLISPLLVLQGFNPKKIAAMTAFIVPFSSLTGFITYVVLGHFNAGLVIPVGIAAYAGGYLGTRFMQARFTPRMVKRTLVVLLLILAVRMTFKLFD